MQKKRSTLHNVYQAGSGTSSAATSQMQPTAGLQEIQNGAGGFVFEVNDWTRLERFLILGTEANTLHIDQKTLTMQNARVVERLVKTDGLQVVETVKSVSLLGRAPKNDQALFVLAACAALGNEATRKAAYEALGEVARIGTHLFQWIEFLKSMKSKDGKKFVSSRGIRNAISRWYLAKPLDKVAYQMVKYAQREGVSHGDLLRLGHVGYVKRGGKKGVATGFTKKHSDLFKYAVDGYSALTKTQKENLPSIVTAVEEATELGRRVEKNANTIDKISQRDMLELIRKHRLTHEMIPTQFKNVPQVWEALLENMPATALVRNLGNMSKAGILGPNSEGQKLVQQKLADKEWLRKSRIHPISVLTAFYVYKNGRGIRGDSTWTVNSAITNALDEAFYLCFMNAPVTGKRFLASVDVSGSMRWSSSQIKNVPGFDSLAAAAAMCAVTLNTEPTCLATAFTCGDLRGNLTQWALGTSRGRMYDGICPVDVSKKMRIEDIIRKFTEIPAGGTDCAMPMLYATKNKIPVDAFIVYTDNETWHGDIKPFQALRQYRETMGIPAKLVVQAFVASRVSIADPNDAGMLDVVGFDSAVPALIADFVSDGKCQTREEAAEA